MTDQKARKRYLSGAIGRILDLLFCLEFGKLKEIEEIRAKERQGERKDLNIVENFPQCNSGKSRDKAAAKVGMSGKSAEKASEVIPLRRNRYRYPVDVMTHPVTNPTLSDPPESIFPFFDPVRTMKKIGSF